MFYYYTDRYPDNRFRKDKYPIKLDEEDLIYVLSRILDFKRPGAINPYEDIDFSGTDLGIESEKYYDAEGDVHFRTIYIPKRYLFTNENGGPIDVRQFEDRVKQQQYLNSQYRRYHRRPLGALNRGERYITYWGSRPCYFRQGSVPDIGHCRGYYTYTPSAHYFQNVKNKENLRPGTVPNSWDACDLRWYRHCDKSWKSSYKCRHQWEKHLIRRNKTNNAYVDMEEDTDEDIFY